ncbi:MAG: tyrosine--tRNA ligase [Alphaproteobacteria bacterium]|nr:tyrosine--tRNA ligase [Alphaproteobacteria bacterium]
MALLDELHARGFVQQCSDEDALAARLAEGPVTVYAGFDPTADSLHVGHLLPLLMLAHFQRAGNRVVALMGGGTGLIGDPSFKTETRMLLDEAAVAANVAKQAAQVRRFLDVDDPARGVLADNASWLSGLQYLPFLREIGALFSVNRMLAAEGYRQRLERGLSFIEFNYQLLQAYDFLVLHERMGVDVQVGGDDQWGNILAGVDLVRRKHAHQVFALTLPLLTTASGAKMGKTVAGAVWLDADKLPVFDFYQYWVNVDDRDVGRFLRLFTFLPLDRVAALEALHGPAVREAKAVLAWEVTALVHGATAADEARAAAGAMVAGAASDDLPTHEVDRAALEAGLPLYALLADAGLVASRSEARRMLQGGGVKLGGDRVDDVEAVLTADQVGDGLVVRVGKKRAARVVVR